VVAEDHGAVELADIPDDAGRVLRVRGGAVIRVFVGYDKAESIAYHTFCQSVLSRSSEPVSFTPLNLANLAGCYRESHQGIEGYPPTNQFIFSRFLVPYLCGFEGYAIFADGDMVCADDIAKLWAMRSDAAVSVVQHDYKTKAATKYLGQANKDYPRKNWSSVILWNCGHPANRVLTPQYVQQSTGSHLHRFGWIPDEQIAPLPFAWNWLADEYHHRDDVSLIHYTLGTPCFNEYRDCDYSDMWHAEKRDVLHVKQLGDVNG